MGTKSAWTPERRARQAQIIRETRPWNHSTGPRTEKGKAISSQNARKSEVIRELMDMLKHIDQITYALTGRPRLRKGPSRAWQWKNRE